MFSYGNISKKQVNLIPVLDRYFLLIKAIAENLALRKQSFVSLSPRHFDILHSLKSKIC